MNRCILLLISNDWQVERPALHVSADTLGPQHRLLAMVEPMADPELVDHLDDLHFNALLAAVEQLGGKEPMVRVELE